MTEHSIRLRGGWRYRAAGSPGAQERPLTLPVRWGAHDPARIVLTRRFGRPRLDPQHETLVLRMENAPGIISIKLNGHAIGAASARISRFEIEIVALLEKNELVLEVEVPGPTQEAAGAPAGWGEIALVVMTSRPADVAPEVRPGHRNSSDDPDR